MACSLRLYLITLARPFIILTICAMQLPQTEHSSTNCNNLFVPMQYVRHLCNNPQQYKLSLKLTSKEPIVVSEAWWIVVLLRLKGTFPVHPVSISAILKSFASLVGAQLSPRPRTLYYKLIVESTVNFNTVDL